MKVEAILNKKKTELELLSKENNIYKIKINDKVYDFDVITFGNGSYSIIYNNKSWDFEASKSTEFNTYNVNKFGLSFKIEIEDSLSKYKKNKVSGMGDGQNNIIAPMPGKIVKVFVKPGQEVKEGDTVLIISAMKMESEFKSAVNGIIKKVNVKDNDIVNGDQLLVEIESNEVKETVEN